VEALAPHFDNYLHPGVSDGNDDDWFEHELGSRDMETGSLLDVLVSLFCSCVLWISAWYKWHRHRFYHVRISVNGIWSFPMRRFLQKVAREPYQTVVGLMGSYNSVHRMIVSFLVSLSFSSLILALAAQMVCTKRGG